MKPFQRRAAIERFCALLKILNEGRHVTDWNPGTRLVRQYVKHMSSRKFRYYHTLAHVRRLLGEFTGARHRFEKPLHAEFCIFTLPVRRVFHLVWRPRQKCSPVTWACIIARRLRACSLSLISVSIRRVHAAMRNCCLISLGYRSLLIHSILSITSTDESPRPRWKVFKIMRF